jgi:hypothetical protein
MNPTPDAIAAAERIPAPNPDGRFESRIVRDADRQQCPAPTIPATGPAPDARTVEFVGVLVGGGEGEGVMLKVDAANFLKLVGRPPEPQDAAAPFADGRSGHWLYWEEAEVIRRHAGRTVRATIRVEPVGEGKDA